MFDLFVFRALNPGWCAVFSPAVLRGDFGHSLVRLPPAGAS